MPVAPLLTIYVERQPDGQYLAYDEAGQIVWHATQTGAAALARVARPRHQVLVGRNAKWRRWQDKHLGRGKAK